MNGQVRVEIWAAMPRGRHDRAGGKGEQSSCDLRERAGSQLRQFAIYNLQFTIFNLHFRATEELTMRTQGMTCSGVDAATVKM